MSHPSHSRNEVRVRFAPSPTGFLHIGGVRTALFNWLYAQQQGGKFLLRIEDTDLERSEERFTADILASMKWLGLTWDEEPLYQSKRLELYLQRAEELIAKGHAYKCWCTEAEVEKMREELQAAGKKPMYDRRCRQRREPGPVGAPYVIRAAIPLEGSIEFHDMIRGPIKFENVDLDDFVLIRSNGAPTYNLSVVVDDVYSRMTHIVRGDDHINNTPKQMHLYQFFQYPVPKFAHLPMILGPDKKKLSKRHGAVSANVYRGEGYLPEALLNFLARLGWSHGDQEVFSIDEMVKAFSFDHVQVSSAVFNLEKLQWLNATHIRASAPSRLAKIVIEDFASFFTPDSLARVDTKIGHGLITAHLSKVKLIQEIAEPLVTLCTSGSIEFDASIIKWGKTPEAKPALKNAISQAVAQLSAKVKAHGPVSRSGADLSWGTTPSLADLGMGHGDVDGFFKSLGEQFGVKLGDLVAPMRVALTGKAVSASVFDLVSLLPWNEVESRLKKLETL
ncbi:MAG: glutamate--tRNA ligase [Bdellovibrionales bacterium]|nr:glutamate--tRNA ligase [Bdellovibrionales bacterium]